MRRAAAISDCSHIARHTRSMLPTQNRCPRSLHSISIRGRCHGKCRHTDARMRRGRNGWARGSSRIKRSRLKKEKRKEKKKKENYIIKRCSSSNDSFNFLFKKIFFFFICILVCIRS
ncbi:hypothetical protein PUN28_017108 [Cardiocondyla obscurior]|uniref:Uncharacterized protein n=1 Tax=Cardiocondyla obscurior TaxID=286306 RepID=A0AAW2EMH6_9HYME